MRKWWQSFVFLSIVPFFLCFITPSVVIGNKYTKSFEFSDLSWTRFGSLPLRSKTRLNKQNGVVSAAKHKDIAVWLRELDLEEYQEAFQKFQGVEDLLEFSETDIKDLGVKKSSHRARIISSLTCLRAKYHG